MHYYYVETPYHCHEMEMGESSLSGPFESAKARAVDIEKCRQEDEWNLQEDGITLLLLESAALITEGETMMPIDPVFEDAEDAEDAE